MRPEPTLHGLILLVASLLSGGTQAAAPKPDFPATAVDIAPFARVVTSDPKRMTGTAATRVEEFPAADICLETEAETGGRWELCRARQG